LAHLGYVTCLSTASTPIPFLHHAVSSGPYRAASVHRAAGGNMSKTHNPISLPKLLTVAQVADHTQFSARQVRRWIKSGALKATPCGRHVRIAENDLALFLASPK
jgi:excisionase family DNA binding protein